MLNLIEKNHTILPFLLGGGSGTRLWPLSRKSMPKQFIELPGSDRSMLQDTLDMLLKATDQMPVVIGSEAHRFVLAEQAQEVFGKLPKIILEPEGRDSAAAVILSALVAQRTDEQAILAVCPSDHRVDDLAAFSKALQDAATIASTGKIVTLGIKANRPATTFGYIQRGEAIEGVDGAFTIKQFHEKPDEETAATYLETGEFAWNAGMFIMRADAFIAEATQHCPEIVDCCRRAMEAGQHDLDFCRLDAEAWSETPAIQFDNAFMEKTDNAAVVEVDFGWADLGSFEDLHRELAVTADDNDNVLHGDVVTQDASNCLVHSSGPAVIAAGVEDLVIIVENDAVLVAKQGETGLIKKALPKLAAKGVTQAEQTARCHRPWGWYETIALGDRYQTKEIMVKPGGQLSLQSHFHRSEHWVVAEGTARITIGDHVGLYRGNESVYVPLGEVHRLENPGKLPMRLIEVQSGGYLGEDDIVRYEDVYGRPEREATEAA